MKQLIAATLITLLGTTAAMAAPRPGAASETRKIEKAAGKREKGKSRVANCSPSSAQNRGPSSIG